MSELKRTADPLPEGTLVFNGKGVVGENIHHKPEKLEITPLSDEVREVQSLGRTPRSGIVQAAAPADPLPEGALVFNGEGVVGEDVHFKRTKLEIDPPSDEFHEVQSLGRMPIPGIISAVTPVDPFDDSKQASNDASAVDLS